MVVFYFNPLHRQLLDEAPFLCRVKATSQYGVYATPGAAH
jgi:hypothetical protein